MGFHWSVTGRLGREGGRAESRKSEGGALRRLGGVSAVSKGMGQWGSWEGGGGGKRRGEKRRGGRKRSKYIQVAYSTVLRLLRAQHRCMETFHKYIHMYSMYVFLYILYIQYILHTEYVHTYICTAPISNTLHICTYVRIHTHVRTYVGTHIHFIQYNIQTYVHVQSADSADTHWYGTEMYVRM